MSREGEIRKRAEAHNQSYMLIPVQALARDCLELLSIIDELREQARLREVDYWNAEQRIDKLESIIDEQRRAMREIWDVFALDLQYATDAEKAAWEKLDKALAAHSLEEVDNSRRSD